MTKELLPTGYIWLSEAVELTAARRWPEEWSDYQLATDEQTALVSYQDAEALYNEYLRVNGASLATLEGVKIGSIAALAQFGTPPEKPEQTIVVFNADHKNKLQQKLLRRAWDELRGALVNGHLSAQCMMDLEPNVTILAEVWGKSPNHSAHPSGRVILGLSDTNNKLRSGKPFLFRSDLLAWLASEDGPEQVASEPGHETQCEQTSATRSVVHNLKRRTITYTADETDGWLAEFTAQWKASQGTGSELDVRLDHGFTDAVKDQFPGIKREVIRKLWEKFDGRKPRYRD